MSVILLLVLMQAQAPAWRTVPAAPTVGDTIWIERLIEAPQGWVVRPGAWAPADEQVEALGPVVTMAVGERVLVRYPLVAWEPGSRTLVPPPVWRIGPAGEADSVPGERVSIDVSSVLPADSIAPRPQREPVEREARAPLPVAAGLAAGVGVMALLWRWRRRPSRPSRPESEPETSRRLEPTGDGRVDAARLAARLRLRVARGVPAAHRALTTGECLAIVGAERPEWPLEELGAVLRRLDDARFAPPADAHIAALAEEVEALERAL